MQVPTSVIKRVMCIDVHIIWPKGDKSREEEKTLLIFRRRKAPPLPSHQPLREFIPSSIPCPPNPQALLLLINPLLPLPRPSLRGWFLSLPSISRSCQTIADRRKTPVFWGAAGLKSNACWGKVSSFWVVGHSGLKLCLIGGIYKTEWCVSQSKPPDLWIPPIMKSN